MEGRLGHWNDCIFALMDLITFGQCLHFTTLVISLKIILRSLSLFTFLSWKMWTFCSFSHVAKCILIISPLNLVWTWNLLFQKNALETIDFTHSVVSSPGSTKIIQKTNYTIKTVLDQLASTDPLADQTFIYKPWTQLWIEPEPYQFI